jgi:ABC-type branched-subunit amino acid transport system ATPase component
VRGVGWTFQVIRVFPELTAMENLLVVTRGRLAAAQARARGLLRFVKLEALAGEYAGNLSTGSRSWSS